MNTFSLFKKLTRLSGTTVLWLLLLSADYTVFYELSVNNKFGRSDTSAAYSYLEAADSLSTLDPDSSRMYADRAEKIFMEGGHVEGVGSVKKVKALLNLYAGNFDSALHHTEKGLSALDDETESKIKGDLLRIHGAAMASKGEYIGSLRKFLEAQSIYKYVGDQDGLNAVSNNIGVTWMRLDNFEKALEIFKELEKVSSDDDRLALAVPVNLGFVHYELGEYERAGEYLNKVRNVISTKDTRYPKINYLLGQIALKEKRYGDAENYYRQAIDGYHAVGNVRETALPMIGLSELFLNLQEFRKAERFAIEAEEIAIRYEALPEQQRALNALYHAARVNGESEKALVHLEKYLLISERLNEAEIDNRIAGLNAEFEYREKEAGLDLLAKEATLKAESAAREKRTLQILFIMTLLMASVITGFLISNNRLKRRANIKLEEKNDEIEEKATKLEQANNEKNRLFSIISHDLRGPITTLSGFLMLHEADELSEEEKDVFISELNKQFSQTTGLMNNLLTWSRSQMEGFTINKNSFPVSEHVEEIIEILKPQAESKKIRIDDNCREGSRVYADSQMIRIVILNLLSNAIKFTRTGGKVDIRTREQENCLQICIEDNGIGMSPEEIRRVFDKADFHSTEGTQEEKGTGIGLMICRDFIESNGGQLRIQSTPGKGSTFCFELPVPKKRQALN